MNRRFEEQLKAYPLYAITQRVIADENIAQLEYILQQCVADIYDKQETSSICELVIEHHWDQGWDVVVHTMPQLLGNIWINDLVAHTRNHSYHQSLIDCLWEQINLQDIHDTHAWNICDCLAKEAVWRNTPDEFDALRKKWDEKIKGPYNFDHLLEDAVTLGRLWVFERLFESPSNHIHFFKPLRRARDMQSVAFLSAYIDVASKYIDINTTQLISILSDKAVGFDGDMFALCGELAVNITFDKEFYKEMSTKMLRRTLETNEITQQQAQQWHEIIWSNYEENHWEHLTQHGLLCKQHNDYSLFDYGSIHHPEVMHKAFVAPCANQVLLHALFGQVNDVVDGFILDSSAQSDIIDAAREKREILRNIDEPNMMRSKKKM